MSVNYPAPKTEADVKKDTEGMTSEQKAAYYRGVTAAYHAAEVADCEEYYGLDSREAKSTRWTRDNRGRPWWDNPHGPRHQ